MVIVTVGLAIVQEMAARMGAVTGKGFADLVRENLGLRTTAFVMLVLVIANGGLVVSEFAGIGAAAELLGVPRFVAVPMMALLIWRLVTRGSYVRVEQALLAVTVAFFAYPVAALLAGPDWPAVGHALVTPAVRLDADYLTLVIALIGKTITPYMQLYVQSSVAEKALPPTPRAVRLDAYAGAVFSDLIAGSIIVATGATLHGEGVRIETAADAARALGPLVGSYATFVFGIGLFGASALAAAVVPLATAYTVTEAFRFEKGVSRTFREAPIFQGLFSGLLLVGAAVALLPGLDTIGLLISTQVLNGLLLPVVLVSILALVNNPRVMRRHVNGRLYNLLAWSMVALIVLLSSVYLAIIVLSQLCVSIG
jgi:Mn2+/Fe2+ NRAMP family transporter